MDAHTRQAATTGLAREMRAFLVAADAFDESVSDALGLNRTDLRCFDLVEQHGCITAGALAVAAHLSTGAVTFVLDRLEQHGFVRRRRDEDDRRRVLVEVLPDARARALEMHQPLVRAMRAESGRFSVAELAIVAAFLSKARRAYEQASTPDGRPGRRRA